MSITAGQTALASDFINKSGANGTPSNDAGRVVKLESDGKVHSFFLRRSFGGNGSDGALTVSSGTTNIDCGGAKVFVKNYTSISITGTGKVTFSNPHSSGTLIVLKVQGDVTLTSSQTPMLDASGMGAAGVAGRTFTGDNGPNYQAYGGNDSIFAWFTTKGAGASGASSSAYNAIVTAISSANRWWENSTFVKYAFTWAGAGGAGAGAFASYPPTTNGQAGNGGNGGGCLVIECAGAWNFTTTNGISVAGLNGTNGTSIGGTNCGVGGGGGGAGGLFYCRYNLLTSNSGSVKVLGGTGGLVFKAGGGSVGPTYSGGGGASLINNGGGGSSAGDGSQGGGNGGDGFSDVQQNIEDI